MTRSATTEDLQQQANQAIAELTISVVKPQKAPATTSIDLPGQTQAYTQAPVFAQTTGYVKKWNFDIGSQVQEGDILGEIETPEVDEQLNQAKATLNQAQSALDLARVTDINETGIFCKERSSLNKISTLRKVIFGQKQATVISDEAAVQRLEALEDFKVLKAPFEGIGHRQEHRYWRDGERRFWQPRFSSWPGSSRFGSTSTYRRAWPKRRRSVSMRN